MSAMDILSNHKVMSLRVAANQTAGSADQLVVNLQEQDTDTGLYERTTDVLVVIEVTNVNTTGDLTVVAKDSNDGTTYDADFATLANIDEAGLYVAHLKGVRNYLKLYTTVADATVAWGAIGIGFNAVRKPVVQTDATEVTVTYGTGR